MHRPRSLARGFSLAKAKVHSDAVKTPQGLSGPGLGQKTELVPREAGQVEVPRPLACSKVGAESSRWWWDRVTASDKAGELLSFRDPPSPCLCPAAVLESEQAGGLRVGEKE